MGFFEWLNHIDTQLFLFLNGKNSPFTDAFFSLFTSKEVWFPLYLLLLVLIISKYKKEGIWVAILLALAIVFSDQVSGLIKDLVQRLRPTHEPALSGLVNMPLGKGGLYGFFSSHASNAFTLSVFTGLLAKNRWLTFWLFLWAAVTAYSRIYVGVHYPFDVLTGIVFGYLTGWGFFKLLIFFDDHFIRKKIQLADKWDFKYAGCLMLALFFITATLFVISLTGKFNFA
ncbi:MAG: phosphatase PAP2 family protein [Prolixibacteraceae bacterium]|nr:phosphatase PAP2 family protein [Prolixibacteraceae bacterium]